MNPDPKDMAHDAKRQAQSEKLSMSRPSIFVRYALCYLPWPQGTRFSMLNKSERFVKVSVTTQVCDREK